jgi:hypothetical protein
MWLHRLFKKTIRIMDNKVYLLKISGTIGLPKHKEFEQTIRFVFNLLPTTCLSNHLSMDVFNPNVYHLLTLWRTSNDLSTFKQSSEFHLIKGAFDTLGYMDRAFAGRMSDVQTFESDNV